MNLDFNKKRAWTHIASALRAVQIWIFAQSCVPVSGSVPSSQNITSENITEVGQTGHIVALKKEKRFFCWSTKQRERKWVFFSVLVFVFCLRERKTWCLPLSVCLDACCWNARSAIVPHRKPFRRIHTPTWSVCLDTYALPVWQMLQIGIWFMCWTHATKRWTISHYQTLISVKMPQGEISTLRPA